MRLSKVFTKTKHQVPKGEVAKNAQLLIKAGFIHKEMAGAYNYLPLGLTVVNKIIQIIREEMDAVGGQELLMTTLQDKPVWEQTERWDDQKVDIWFKTALKNKSELGLGWSHEAPVTAMMKSHISSYKDLPQYVYQFQNKLRNELRAKSGLLRTREFMMKDLYSFSLDSKQHEKFYESMKKAYFNIFNRVGIGDLTYLTVATGEPFTSGYSHEFQTICDAGEDIVYLDRKKKLGINKEVYSDETMSELGLKKAELEEVKAAEVGNIFPLEQYFAKTLGLSFTDSKGEQRYPVMGSYGIGPGRVMGVIAEVFGDDKGLVWPISVAPAQAQIVPLGNGQEVMEEAELQYKKLQEQQLEVILDDRDLSAGEKLNDADLIGLPVRIVVSAKTLAVGSLEVKRRDQAKAQLIKTDQLTKHLAKIFSI